MSMSSTGIIICDAVSQVHLHNWFLQSVKMLVHWDVARKLQMGGRRGSHTLSHLRYLPDYPSSCVACFWMSSEQCIQCLLWYLYFFHIWIIPFACSWQKHILSYKEVMDTLGPPLSSTPVISLAMHWWFSRRWKQMIQLFLDERSADAILMLILKASDCGLVPIFCTKSKKTFTIMNEHSCVWK